ncbi:hypothetical protein [Nocardioides sp. LHG3406-4]|uniref:hypothetical protein n=1 Tax=Nocardioides sp. LHG3406-4 TaxID=2804575 RepID=UPI003CF97BC8
MATDAKAERTPGKDKRSVRGAVDTVRARLAQLIWLVCVLAALVLAVGALLVALKANKDNDLVSFVLSAADAVDLGVFSRADGIKEFVGENAGVKNALFNWGLGAIAWLVVGRILDRLIRP